MRTYRLLVLCALLASCVMAAPLTFTYTGSGSGSLSGTSFTSADFTITALADTSAVLSFGTGYLVNHASASIDLSGFGVLNFTTATSSFVNNSNQTIGFSRNPLDLYSIFNVPGAGTWDMQSSFGPIAFSSGASAPSGLLFQWNDPIVLTSGGQLLFSTDGSAGTFQATVGEQAQIPEPATFALIAVGLAGLALSRRRR